MLTELVIVQKFAAASFSSLLTFVLLLTLFLTLQIVYKQLSTYGSELKHLVERTKLDTLWGSYVKIAYVTVMLADRKTHQQFVLSHLFFPVSLFFSYLEKQNKQELR